MIGRVVLGRYRILCLLARGGMGEVYLARSEGAAGFHRPVVIKRVLAEHASDKTILALFRREARVMSSLRHPNIVSVLDFGEDSGDHLMVIEYVHGFHLGRWREWTAQRRPFPVERAIQIVLEMLDALEHAHTAVGADGAPLGIVHRDVSPGNVLIDLEGTVKLADFGVARMQGEHTEVEDASVSLKGKFAYLSPELFDGTAASPASDTYAAAVVLDELLRGENVFRTTKVTETITRVMKHSPSSLDRVRGDIPLALARVVQKALVKRPEARFTSAASFAEALRAVRTMSADEAKRELAAATRADFLDPAMAVSLEVAQLSELEALWHGPAPAVDDAASLERVRREEMPTLTAVLPLPPKPAPSRGLAIAATVASAIVLCVATIAGAFVLTRPPPLEAGGPVVILVDHGAASVAGADASAGERGELADAGVATAALPPSEATPEAEADPTPAHHAPHAPRIEAPFRARSAQIGRCFTDHVRSVEGSPELVVRFEVRADGTVERASLTPSAIQSTDLGACLLDVARTTRFSPQSAPVTFVVPLGARRVGGG